MHVHFRRFQLVVPQQLFYDFQVRALLDQMRGERVSQQVGVHPLGDSGFLRRLFQLLRHDALRKRLALVPLEEPFLRLVQLGVLGQFPDKGLRQQRVAVFPPFALPYPYQRTAHVNVVGLQVQQLADSQPGGVEQENMQNSRMSGPVASRMDFISSLLSTSGSVRSRLARFTS